MHNVADQPKAGEHEGFFLGRVCVCWGFPVVDRLPKLAFVPYVYPGFTLS